MNGTQAYVENWWNRHHRLASNLFEDEIPCGPTGWDRDPYFPYLDLLCEIEQETPADSSTRGNLTWMARPDNHSSFVTQVWKNAFSDPTYWYPQSQLGETQTLCPLCGGECRFQIQPSEPTAPHTATCTYAPWDLIKRELQAEARLRNIEPRSTQFQEFVQENLNNIIESVKRSGGGLTAYLIRVNDLATKKHRHIVLRQEPSVEEPILFGPWLVLAGVFENGMGALLFRIDELGPSGAHELTDEQIARLFQ